MNNNAKKSFGEGNEHFDAKMKLFNAIKSNNYKIIDYDKNEYIIMTGEYQKEFLHVEPIAFYPVGNTYESPKGVLYAGDSFPCVDVFKTNKLYRKEYVCGLKCEQEYVENHPCFNCFMKNFNTPLFIKGVRGTRFFVPDIAYGYDGKYKIWFEIVDTHDLSKEKVNFCDKNNIIVLRFLSKDIMDSEDNVFLCEKITMDIFTKPKEVKRKFKTNKKPKLNCMDDLLDITDFNQFKQGELIDVISEYYNEFFNIMDKKANEVSYFDYNKIYNYLISHLPNERLKTYDKVEKIIHKTLNVKGYSRLSASYYIEYLDKFIDNFKGEEKIIIKTEISKQIYEYRDFLLKTNK